MKTFVVLFFALAYVCADVSIVKQDFDMEPDGKKFSYLWETSDGTHVDAVGHYEGDEQGAGGVNIDGNVKYVDPIGNPVAWSFTSGPNGFVATGDVIPSTPPHVVKLLGYLATLPPRKAN